MRLAIIGVAAFLVALAGATAGVVLTHEPAVVVDSAVVADSAVADAAGTTDTTRIADSLGQIEDSSKAVPAADSGTGAPGDSSDAGPVHPVATIPAVVAGVPTPAPAGGRAASDPAEGWRQLGKILTQMKTADAARVLSYLPDTDAEGVLRSLPARTAAALLTAMPEEKAGAMARRLLVVATPTGASP